MVGRNDCSRRESLAIIAGGLMLPAFATGSASAVSRRRTMTGERVAKLDAIDDIMRGFMQKRVDPCRCRGGRASR